MKKYYHKNNFHKHTFCDFKEVFKEEIERLGLSYKSKSGSSYYFTEQGVYRVSNHWGRAANCRWRLKTENKQKINNAGPRIGYANWNDFYPNNEEGKWFYIEIDWQVKEVSFQHKNNPLCKEENVFRNASETAKRIQIIREVLLEDNWAKYLIFENLEVLRKEVIYQLINTQETFLAIKQKYR